MTANARRELFVTVTLVVLVLMGAAVERARGGVETLFIAQALLLGASAFRRLCASLGRVVATPGVVALFELASFAGLFTYPPSAFGPALAGGALLVQHLRRDGEDEPGSGLEEVALLASAGVAVALAWRSGSRAAIFVLAAFALVTAVSRARRTAEAALGLASGFSLVAAAALLHGYERLEAPLRAEPILLVLAAIVAVRHLSALIRPLAERAFPATLRRRLVFAALAAFLGTALSLGLIEFAAQVNATRHPAFRRVSLEPDPVRGWRHRPGFRYRWAGPHWYAREFSVEIAINAHGDRDCERELAKAPGVIRIAVLGDSFVEAEQVELEATATAILERRLSAGGRRAEVLNFGVSSYGLGQCFLTFEDHASRFAPDYLVLFAAAFHMVRTVTPRERGAFPSTSAMRLSIRPTFGLEQGRLTWQPPRDFEEFRRLQGETLRRELGGERLAVRGRELFIGQLVRAGLAWASSEGSRRARIPTDDRLPDEPALALNLKVVEALGESARRRGARLLVADVARYITPEAEPVSQALRRLCESRGFGWIDLSARLLAAEQAEGTARWPIDGHFNALGNRVFAEAMFESLRSR